MKNKSPFVKQRQALLVLLMVVGILVFTPHPNLWANDVQNINYMERGFFRILTAAFQLPRFLVYKTMSGPPLVGTVDGVLTGTFAMVSSLMGGVFDIAKGTVPYGKYALPFLFL